jgi:protein-tyrosine kinase
MREVDDALARAYAKAHSGSPDQANAGVPPRPHVAPRRPFARTRPGQHDAGLLTWPSLVLTLEQTHGDRFERMADALLDARARHQLKVLLFTSGHRAEGRTTLVLTLARTLSRRPGRTLLVDADLSGPMLARQLGVRPEVGLDDVVEHGQALAEALIEAPGQNLTLLPLRAPVGHPRGFLASPGWACAMARVRRDFDLVLVDGSPLFSGLSAAVLHRSVDAAVLVHSRTLTGARGLARARDVLEAGGVPLLGLAETFVV